MKKVLSLILAAAMIFALVISFSGCNLKPKTPSERFREAKDNIGAELRVGPLDKKYEIKDINFCDLSIDVEAPQFIGDEKVSFTVKGGFDSDAGNVSAEFGAKYKSSELNAKAEIDGRETVFISFPGMSDEFIWAKLSDFAETAEDASDLLHTGSSLPVDELFNSKESILNKVRSVADELLDKYVVDETVKVETEDVEVIGNTVKNADKLSLTLNKEQVADIVTKLLAVVSEETEDDVIDTENVSGGSVALWVAGGKTVRAELTVAGTESSASVIYQMDEKIGEVRANLDISMVSDGETVMMIPLRYEHEEEKGTYTGKFGLDESGLIIPENMDYEIDASSISVEFEGTASANSADMTYTFKVGSGGMTIKIPVNLKISKAGANADNIEVTIDSQLIGVKLTAKGVVTHENTIRVAQYDLSRGIKAGENATEQDEERLEALGSELSGKLGDFSELAGNILGAFMGGGLDYDYDDWDDEEIDEDDADIDDILDGIDLGSLLG